jgi:hypothetical protein
MGAAGGNHQGDRQRQADADMGGGSRLPNTAITISSLLTRANGQTMEDNHSMMSAVV